MVGEIVVLGGQQGMDEVLRDVGEADRRPAHLAELGDELAVLAVDLEGDLQLDVTQSFHRGQAGTQIEIGAAETEQHSTNQGDASPPQELQQAHG